MHPDSTTATFDFRVANQVDAGTLEMLQQNALLLILVLVVLFVVGAILFKRGRGPRPREE